MVFLEIFSVSHRTVSCIKGDRKAISMFGIVFVMYLRCIRTSQLSARMQSSVGDGKSGMAPEQKLSSLAALQYLTRPDGSILKLVA